MKIYTTTGIVFRTLKYGETSLILDVYTSEKGLRSYIVSGVRSKKGKAGNSALYQLMNQLEIVAYDNDSEKLCRIKEAKLSHHYLYLQSDVVRSSLGMFILEVCRNAIREKEPNPELFEFLKTNFDRLDLTDLKMRFFPHQFMLQLSRFLGFYPLPNYTELNAYFDITDGVFTNHSFKPGHMILDKEDSIVISELLMADKNNGFPNFNTTDTNKILEILIQYYKEHLPDFRSLKSLDVIRTILHH